MRNRIDGAKLHFSCRQRTSNPGTHDDLWHEVQKVGNILQKIANFAIFVKNVAKSILQK